MHAYIACMFARAFAFAYVMSFMYCVQRVLQCMHACAFAIDVYIATTCIIFVCIVCMPLLVCIQCSFVMHTFAYAMSREVVSCMYCNVCASLYACHACMSCHVRMHVIYLWRYAMHATYACVQCMCACMCLCNVCT